MCCQVDLTPSWDSKSCSFQIKLEKDHQLCNPQRESSFTFLSFIIWSSGNLNSFELLWSWENESFSCPWKRYSWFGAWKENCMNHLLYWPFFLSFSTFLDIRSKDKKERTKNCLTCLQALNFHGWVVPKTFKMVLNASRFCAQYKKCSR